MKVVALKIAAALYSGRREAGGRRECGRMVAEERQEAGGSVAEWCGGRREAGGKKAEVRQMGRRVLCVGVGETLESSGRETNQLIKLCFL